MVTTWLAGSARAACAVKGPRSVPRLHDPQEQPGAARGVRGAELAAEGDRGAAVVVGVNLLGQPGEAFGLRHGRGEHRGSMFRGGGIVLPVGVAGCSR